MKPYQRGYSFAASRNAPDRSTTRAPASSATGASASDASAGVHRKTTSSPANAAAVASVCGRTATRATGARHGQMWSASVVPAHLSLTASASARRGWPATMRASSIPE